MTLKKLMHYLKIHILVKMVHMNYNRGYLNKDERGNSMDQSTTAYIKHRLDSKQCPPTLKLIFFVRTKLKIQKLKKENIHLMENIFVPFSIADYVPEEL